MSKINILLLITALGMAACSNQDEENCTPNPTTCNYLPTNDSSWWAYSVTNVFSNGDRILVGRDTLRSLGEMEVNGQTYIQYEGSLWFYSTTISTFLSRDSANYLVDDNGLIILPYLNYTDTFNHFYSNGNLVRFSKLITDTAPTAVPAGTFTTIDFRGVQFRQSNSYCTDSIGYYHHQFAENVGLVRSTYWFSSTGPCRYFERVLESYHIE
jgi:hypothetical protein